MTTSTEWRPGFWRRLRYKLYMLRNFLFMVECPCCHGDCGYYQWGEPPEDCGYCKNEGIVFRYRAWEWNHFIMKNHLPPSMVPWHVIHIIRYKDCPEPVDMHLGCKTCNSRGIVHRFGGGPVA